MKKIIFVSASVLFIAATLIIGCQTSQEKATAAQVKVLDEKQDLKTMVKNDSTEAVKAASAEEWKTFRNESEVKIKKNEIRIAELKVELLKPGQTSDVVNKNRIDSLEQKNSNLRTRMDNYEKSKSNWESFKLEFNHDMEGLGHALKDFTVKNKK